MPRISKHLSSDRGIALVLVLWVLVLLTMIAAEFTFSVRVESKAVGNFKDETKAYYLAFAGVNMALSEIRTGEPFVLDDGNIVNQDTGRNFYETMGQRRQFSLGDGLVSYRIEDEQGKLNLNTASRESIKNLLRICGVEHTEQDIITDSILDWRDMNHEHHLNGAEDDYYMSLSQPYEAKDGFFDTPEELLLVRGMTPVIFYGREGLHPVFSSSGNSNDYYSGLKCTGLMRFVTVKGSGRLNINTADETVLEAVFGDGKTQEILLRREIEGSLEEALYGGTVKTNVFSIASTGEVNGIKTFIKVMVERGNGEPGLRVTYWNEGRTFE